MNRGRIFGLLPALLIAGISLGLVHSAFAGKKCLEDPTHPSCGSDGGGGAGGAMMATFGDVAGDGLKSDDGGPYVDGEEDVSVSIGKEGNFVMTLGKGNKATVRKVRMDFSNCMAPSCDPPFTPPDYPDYSGFSDGPFNVFSSGVDLNALSDSAPPTELALEIRINLDQAGLGLWNIYFDQASTQCPGSSNALVTRTAADTWRIEGFIACLTEKSGQGGAETPAGIYDMPFLLVVHTT